MGESQSPSAAFKALLKRYAAQRSRGVFPNGMFTAANGIDWVDVNTPANQLEPACHRQLSDGELSALAGKPVFDIRIAATPNTPKNINGALSKAGAREHWRIVKKELQNRMGLEVWKQLENPKHIREDADSALSAYSFQVEMKNDPDFPPPPALPPEHILHGFKVPMKWPRQHSSRRVSDISVIRIHPTSFGPKALWEHLTSLTPSRMALRMPRQINVTLQLQGHEQGHTMQPYPDNAPHMEAYYGEDHADEYMKRLTLHLGMHPGHIDAWHAARTITSQTYTNAFGPNAWSCHTTTPSSYFGGFDNWPITKLNAMRRQLRAYTDLMLVGEDCNLGAAEIEAFTRKDEKFFKQFDNRKAEVSRQLGRARLAEQKVDKKPALKVERRLMALKKMWNDHNLKMDKELLFMVGHTLEAAELFWPAIKDPDTKLTPAKCAPFRPRKRPAPAA